MLLVDAANVVGSRPTGCGETGPRRPISPLPTSAAWSPRSQQPSQFVVVLKGLARQGIEEGVVDGVEVVHASGHGDDTIIAVGGAAAEPVTLVSADRALADRCRAVGSAARVFDANPDAVIAVERINGAVLAISGTDDTLWPSSLMADRVMKRLADHHHPFPFEHLRYVEAGHAITRPYVATRGLPHGGTAAGAARANEHSWVHGRAFLQANLAP